MKCRFHFSIGVHSWICQSATSISILHTFSVIYFAYSEREFLGTLLFFLVDFFLRVFMVLSYYYWHLTDKSIAKGKLVVDVTYFIFHVHSETHDFCSGTPCPATGEFVLASEQTLPSYTPPGSYTLQMKLLGEKNEELTCISFGFSIGFVAPVAISWTGALSAECTPRSTGICI